MLCFLRGEIIHENGVFGPILGWCGLIGFLLLNAVIISSYVTGS